jgi:hypothetical protein
VSSSGYTLRNLGSLNPDCDQPARRVVAVFLFDLEHLGGHGLQWRSTDIAGDLPTWSQWILDYVLIAWLANIARVVLYVAELVLQVLERQDLSRWPFGIREGWVVGARY